ncbi:hypothetical protein QA612_20535 [Evansella sp. AB-P1]|uniref:hypothetical protein n=1 Tax=Evansella sp. AB-P1 TaxID=3037653 RepID=UPI00241D256D|nr:hypothetical protein [Evansella sp. AB-P1]MDG5789848.1 hypothetical protein [Evansella sp. AB-P1]
MNNKRPALVLNIVANIFYALSLLVWAFVALMGIMSIANLNSFFNFLAFLYLFLLLYVLTVVVSCVLSWKSYLDGKYIHSYKWMTVPLIHAILFVSLFTIGLWLE